jgi:hypothetical protein
MILVINVKDTNNIIGLKEDIAMRLEGCLDVQGIGVYKNNEIKIISNTENNNDKNRKL